MLWFNPAKRHGFIRSDDGARLRVDENGFVDGGRMGDGCRGTRVSFDWAPGELEQHHAVNVTALPIFAARRARTRFRGRR